MLKIAISKNEAFEMIIKSNVAFLANHFLLCRSIHVILNELSIKKSISNVL